MSHLSYRFFGERQRPNGYHYSFTKLEAAFATLVDLNDEAEQVLIQATPGSTATVRDKQQMSLVTMWETDTLPKPMAYNLERFDQVFTPSRASAALLEQAHGQVRAVGLGVDPSVFHPPGAKERPPGPFRFLTSGHSPRKGLPELLEAWRIAALPDAELIIKTFPGASPSLRGGLPEGVRIVRQSWPESKVGKLWREADAYITCSYGEGWDLPAFQAAACGMPVIAPKHTCYPDYGDHIAIWLTELRAERAAMDVYGAVGNWLRPDPAEIAEALRLAMDLDRSEWRRKGALLGANHTWNDVAARILAFYDDLPLLYEAGAEKAVQFRMPVRALLDHAGYDIGGATGELVAGERYDVTWEVARVLEAAGYVEVL